MKLIAMMTTLTVTGNVTLTSTDLANRLIKLTGTPAAGFDVNFPYLYGEWTIINDTNRTATMQVSGQSSPPTLATQRAGIVTVPAKVIKLTDVAL